MKYPLVSIGIPTFDRPVLLDKCLASISDYTYRNIEIIISENSQHSPTDKVVANYSHLCIRYYRQYKNIGIINNFKFVLTHASGNFFFFHSDDDSYGNSFVQDAIESFNANPDIVTFFGVTALCHSAGLAKREHRCYLRYSTKKSFLSDAITLYNVNNLLNFSRPNKLNYLIYAIHRTDVIKWAFLGVVDKMTNERDIISGLALSGRIEVNDKTYYHRLIHEKSTGASVSFVSAIKKAFLVGQQLDPMERLRLSRLSPRVAFYIACHLSSLRQRSPVRILIFTTIIYWRNISLVVLELLLATRDKFIVRS